VSIFRDIIRLSHAAAGGNSSGEWRGKSMATGSRASGREPFNH
jgi:hypothetical protein